MKRSEDDMCRGIDFSENMADDKELVTHFME